MKPVDKFFEAPFVYLLKILTFVLGVLLLGLASYMLVKSWEHAITDLEYDYFLPTATVCVSGIIMMGAGGMIHRRDAWGLVLPIILLGGASVMEIYKYSNWILIPVWIIYPLAFLHVSTRGYFHTTWRDFCRQAWLIGAVLITLIVSGYWTYHSSRRIRVSGRIHLPGSYDRYGNYYHDKKPEEKVPEYSEGLLRYKADNGLWGYLNKEGKIAINPRFKEATEFSEGMAAVVDSSRKWGYINRSGEMIISPRFMDANGFSEGLAVVRGGIDGYHRYHWYYIDKNGEHTLPGYYLKAYDFHKGKARVMQKAGRYKFINLGGEEVPVPERY